jgi:hypothetical protein
MPGLVQTGVGTRDVPEDKQPRIIEVLHAKADRSDNALR